MKSVAVSFDDRFWQSVDQSAGPAACWRWTAGKCSGGYGRIRRQSRGPQLLAHRVAYEMEHGDIPLDLQIDHLCRVRDCVNPAHLEAVPQRVNILRGESLPARLARQATCKRGHKLEPIGSRPGRYCRTCARDRARNRYASDPDYRAKIISTTAAWAHANKDVVTARKREWRARRTDVA